MDGCGRSKTRIGYLLVLRLLDRRKNLFKIIQFASAQPFCPSPFSSEASKTNQESKALVGRF